MQCPRCHHENPAAAGFCNSCGGRLQGPPGEPSGGPAVYTPRHLAENILTSRSALEGERKQVTVLFADLKSSLELLADRDPEEAHGILHPLLQLMMEAVHRYEGTVNQVMGDGIMALFGAPLARRTTRSAPVTRHSACMRPSCGTRRNCDSGRASPYRSA